MEQKLVMLIVDDFDINRAVLKSIFKWEYEIIEAGDGKEALEIIHSGCKIDVILLDIIMPNMDGIELLSILKQEKNTDKIPVVVNTQMGEQENEIKCLELGADDFIVKPYNPQIIKRRVANLVQKYVLERQQMEDALQETSDQLDSLIDTVPGGIAILELSEKLMVKFYNDGLCRLLGYRRGELNRIFASGRTLFIDEQEENKFIAKLREEAEGVIHTNHAMMKKDGEELWAGISVKRLANQNGKMEFHAVFLDLTEEKEAQNKMLSTMEELRLRAERDWLTGIYNRETFYEKLEEMIANNPNVEYVLELWNIDRFKVVNELFGSVTGDKVLIEFAEYLDKRMRHIGLYGRLDADRFAVCISKKELEKSWEEVQYILKNGFTVPEINYPIYLHLGLYQIEDKSLSANKMCDRARLAIQSVRWNYINRWAYYSDELKDSLLSEQELVNEMEKAISKNQFYVNYQPIFSARSNELVSAEALVRWRHPEKGIISPGDFIPLFEKNGFITKLDFYVWESVCRFLAENKKNGIQNVPISVNVSRINLYNKDLCKVMEGLLEKYGIEPKFLKLEITESAYTENPEQLLSAMAVLQNRGFKVLMDDFGSGYSSLNMLKDVPVDILKIDMKFIDNLDTSERACKILYNIIQMAHGLNMEIVAEGVENDNQFELLKRMGCDCIQGYYFSRPLGQREFVSNILKISKIYSGTTVIRDNYTILVADDVEMNRAVVAENLNDRYRVIQAENGLEALEILKTDVSGVDLVITDIMMPQMNGFELIDKIKNNDYLKNIPVIILSAMEETESEIKALALGAIDVIAKPFEPEVLRRRVENILQVSVNENTQAELHALRKSTVLRQKFVEMLKGELVGICQVILNRSDEMKTMHIMYANEEFMKIHQLSQTSLAAITQTRRLVENMEEQEAERVLKLICKALEWKEHAVQIFYHVETKEGYRRTMLCNVQIEYREDEVHLEIAEMSVFDATMFEKPAIIDDFTFALLQETGIHFWKYNIMKDQIIFRRRQLADRNKMEVLENGMEQFEENIIFENSDRNRIRKMHERIQNGEKSTVEIFWCRRLDEENRPTGQFWWNKIIYQTIFDEYGHPKEAIGISEDVTGQMRSRVRKHEAKAKKIRHKEYLFAEIDLTEDRFMSLETSGLATDVEEKEYSIESFVRDHLAAHIQLDETGNVLEDFTAQKLFTEYESGTREVVTEFHANMTNSKEYEWFQSTITFMTNEINEHIYANWKINNINSEKNKRYYIEKMAEQDVLTEVFNRNAFASRVDAIMQKKEAKTVLSAFFMVDVDNFKSVNDTFGHEFGDTVLKAIAEQLTKVFRKDDLIGRIGGDEFAVFIPCAASKEIVCKRAQRLCENVQVAFKKSKQVVHTSCSVGIAFGTEDGTDFQSLYGKADTALYMAKKRGKNTFCVVADCNEK